MSIQTEINRIKAEIQAAYTAVSGKGGTVPASKTSENLAVAIDSIQLGVDTSDATAAAGDILSGKTAYVEGSKVTGTIAGKGAADLTASGASVTVPAGYYPQQVSKSVAAAAQATPTISIDANGKITASAAQTAGYVAAGTKSATQQMTTKAAATITPGTADQTIESGTYLTGAQTVEGDANLKAANIKSGVSIFGVAGSYTGTASGFKTQISNSSGYSLSVQYYDPEENSVKSITVSGYGTKVVYAFGGISINLDASSGPAKYQLSMDNATVFAGQPDSSGSTVIAATVCPTGKNALIAVRRA